MRTSEQDHREESIARPPKYLTVAALLILVGCIAVFALLTGTYIYLVYFNFN
jgi:hypothetical protein